MTDVPVPDGDADVSDDAEVANSTAANDAIMAGRRLDEDARRFAENERRTAEDEVRAEEDSQRDIEDEIRTIAGVGVIMDTLRTTMVNTEVRIIEKLDLKLRWIKRAAVAGVVAGVVGILVGALGIGLAVHYKHEARQSAIETCERGNITRNAIKGVIEGILANFIPADTTNLTPEQQARVADIKAKNERALVPLLPRDCSKG